MPYTSLTPAKYVRQMKTATDRDAIPEADSPEDDSPCQWDPMCTGRGTARIADGGHTYTACDDCADDAMTEDSPEDVDAPQESSTRVALDDGHADVDVFTDRIEVTIRLGGRSVLGIALSHMEAANLGRAIASPDGATTGDLFNLADTLGVDAAEIMRLRDRAVTA